VFMHLSKTGGSTVYPSLQWNYPPSRTLHIDIPRNRFDKMEGVPIDTRSNLLLVHGHFAYGIHKYIPRRCHYVTLLREPVARVISAYKFILKRTDHELHHRVVEERIDLEEFIERFWTEEKRNRQVRDLCNEYGDLTRDTLEDAKRNLDTFLVVGLTEHFEETFALLRRTLRLRRPFYVTRNVGFPLDPSNRAKDLIREREQLDVELYAYARELFGRQVAAQGRTFGLEVAAYRAMRPVSRATGSGRVEDFLRRVSHARRAWDRARVPPFTDVRPDESFPWGGAPRSGDA
jgi:Galactose-3-O-sulfotransferase